MKSGRKYFLSLVLKAAAAYFLIRLFFLIWGGYSQLHSNINIIDDNPENMNIVVTYSENLQWKNLFRFDYIISKVTEVSYVLATFFLTVIFLQAVHGDPAKGIIISSAKNMGLWLLIGAGYKFLIWPPIETLVRDLDKVNIPFNSSDPLIMLIGAAIFIAAINADKFRAELEAFV